MPSTEISCLLVKQVGRKCIEHKNGLSVGVNLGRCFLTKLFRLCRVSGFFGNLCINFRECTMYYYSSHYLVAHQRNTFLIIGFLCGLYSVTQPFSRYNDLLCKPCDVTIPATVVTRDLPQNATLIFNFFR